MKKLIYGSMLLASAALIFVGCQKEDVQPIENSVDSNQATNFVEKANGNLRVWFDTGGPNEGVDFGCKDTGGNCQPNVVVVGRLANVVNTIGDLGDLGDIPGVVAVVSDNLTELSTFIEMDLLELVVDEKLSLSVRGRVNANEGAYLLFSDGKDLISVQPVKL